MPTLVPRISHLVQLRAALATQPADALLVSQPQNVRWGSGFSGSLGFLLVGHEAAYLVTDSRYYIQAAEEAPAYELLKLDKRLAEVLKPVLEGHGWRRLGFEARHVTVAAHEDLARALEGVELVPLRDVVDECRKRKDAAETALLRRAVAVGDAAFARFVEWVRPGVTERAGAWAIDTFLRECGGDEPAFPTIVAAGPNAAKPHAVPSDRPIGAGEPLVLDFGARLQGYCSDMTRTICLGPPADDTFLSVYHLVLRAQETAMRGLRPGLNGKQADALARDVIANDPQGFPPYEHGLGHGIGLAVHEEPRLSKLAEESQLDAGMVLTVEPGIYIEGWGGVRLEDMGLLTAEGYQGFTQSPKQPVVNGR